MSNKVSASDIARISLDWAAVQPPIPYVNGGRTRKGADCQGLVKGCITEAGGDASHYKGSNDMYRSCHLANTLWTLADAKRSSKLIPGALMFRVQQDGGEQARGYHDGLGNADHVSVYVNKSDSVWSVDASESAKSVRTRTKREAEHLFTHVGWLPEIEYVKPIIIPEQESELPAATADAADELSSGGSAPPSAMNPPDPETVQRAYYALVQAMDGGTVNLRSQPTTLVDNRKGKMPSGSQVVVLESRSSGWSRVRFMGVEGWAQSQYLKTLNMG